MKNKSSFDDLLNQINEILDMFQQPISNLKPPSPTASSDLQIIEKAVQILSNYQEISFKNANLDADQLIQEKLDSSQLEDKSNKFFRQAKNIENKVNVYHSTLAKIIEDKKKQKISKNKINKTTKQQQERRKLFKSIGGDNNWIPL